MSEEWRTINDGVYAVSSLGRVRREKPGRATYAGRILSCRVAKIGYPVTAIGGPPVYVHSLVAAAFLGPRPEGYEVNHKDGDKTNNCVANLEYVTQSENIAHAYRIGLRTASRVSINVGVRNGQSRITEDDVRTIRTRADSGESRRKIALAFGLSSAAVDAIVWRRNWKHVA